MRAREFKYRYRGGKLDDITVIVAYIKETKNDIENSLTRDNSTADLAESGSEKSALSPRKNLKETLSSITMNGNFKYLISRKCFHLRRRKYNSI